MPSSYTSNLGIEKPGDGEQSGTWGDTVNDNMDILDRAINGVLNLTLSGSASDLLTGDGSLSDGQYKLVLLSGAPSATHTVTIKPNDAEKIYFVTNNTASTVVFTQGSGGNVTVLAGDGAVIYADGGGTGAAVSTFSETFFRNAVRITGGTITGITDLAVADGGTGASTAAGALVNLGLTATAAELNTMDGITATTAELNILDGVTATTAELNILDGVTATTAELNILDGVTATTAELNYVDGVTSALQTQLDAKQPLDATLTALAGLSTGANKIPMASGTDTFTQIDFKDEDDMASNSATAVPSQQSTKAYVDTVAAVTIATSGTFSGQSTLSLTGLDFTTYAYQVILRGVVPSSDNTDLQLTVSADGGSTYITAGYYYANTFLTTDATSGSTQGASAASVRLSGSDGIGSAPTEYGVNAVLDIAQTAGKPISVLGNMSYVTGASLVNGGTVSGGLQTDTTAINALRLQFGAGTLESGKYTVYRKRLA
jgi:hypothetical protein